MPKRIATVGALAPVLLLAGTPQRAPAQPANCVPTSGLNGLWHGNDGGYFLVREVGTEVWWVGFDDAGDGRNWTTVFRGTRAGDTITGSLADVIGSKAGTMSLQVQGTWRMDKTATNIFGYWAKASSWTHRCLAP